MFPWGGAIIDARDFICATLNFHVQLSILPIKEATFEPMFNNTCKDLFVIVYYFHVHKCRVLHKIVSKPL